MNTQVYVFGHKNPDTDSACSAIAYAQLKTQLGYNKMTACKLGNINVETKFVLDYFDTPEPCFLPDVRAKIGDLNIYKPIRLLENAPVKYAWDALKESGGSRIIPVVNENNNVAGIITLGDIAKLFVEVSDESVVSRHEILFKNLLEILEGKIIAGSYNFDRIEGSMYIGTNIPDDAAISEKDIILTAKLENALKFAHVHNCGCVILTDGIKPRGFEGVKSAVVSVDFTMFKTVSLISSAISLRSIMKKEGIISFSIDNYVDDIIDIMKSSKHRNFPVVDIQGAFVGIISRRHLIDFNEKKVILVDHNERSQSVEGLDQARILEIIDHHRVADIQTEYPLFIRSEPVGCTSTIVYKMYRENNLEIQPKIAGLMLGAILSDTLMFRSPTCTQEDINAANALAKIAGVVVEDFGREMFTASTSLEDYSTDEILAMDRKCFTFDKYCTYISQVNTLDFRAIVDREAGILQAMEEYCKLKGCDLVMLMVTDIVAGGSEVLAVGKAKDLMLYAFGMKREETNIFLADVVSRKKQIVPRLMQAANMV